MIAVPHQKGIKPVAQNRKAFHDYFVEERYECGIELYGTEVKSMRLGRVSLKESWAHVLRGEIFVEGMHISPYEQGNQFNRDPMRPKRLLLHKSEIRKLDGRTRQAGRHRQAGRGPRDPPRPAAEQSLRSRCQTTWG